MTGPARRLRLLYLIDSLAPGGSERSLAALAPHYRDLGVELTVGVLLDREGVADEIRSAGGEIVSLAGTTGRLRQLAALRALVAERRPELVHTTLFESDVLGRIAARSARTPVVTSLVNEAYGPEHAAEPGVRRSRLRAAQTLDALTGRLAVRQHAVSEQVKRVMARRLRYPADRIDVVPRGRDPEVLGRRTDDRRRAARRALGIDDDHRIVLVVARHEPAKAIDQVVEALSIVRVRHPEARLVVAGREGTDTSVIRTAIERFAPGDQVLLLGARDDVPDLLCAADVFVLASRREGMPGSVIEAMALEAPIVASDLPQVREVTGTDGAQLTPVNDPAAVATAINTLLDDPGAAREQARRARIRFERSFTISATAPQMVEFYYRALGRRR